MSKCNYASYKSLGKDINNPKEEPPFKIEKITSLEHRNHFKQKFDIVIIENYTDWCGPCKTVGPLFTQMAKKFLDSEETNSTRIAFVKENVDDNINGILSVRGVPCFHFFVNGKNAPKYNVVGGDIKKIVENINDLLKK